MMANNNNIMHIKKRHVPEAQEWYFRLMNDPNQFEKERFIDSINVFNSIIEEFQKMYDKTPATDRFACARIQSGMKIKKRLGKNSGQI